MTESSAEPDDLDMLLSEAIGAAQFFLEERGEFLPFAVTLSPDGSMNQAQGHTQVDQSDVAEVMSLLERGLAEGAAHGRYHAIALVSDVTLGSNDGDVEAIRVHLEHSDGRCVDCFLTYQATEPGHSDSAFQYGEVEAEEGEPIIDAWGGHSA